VRDTRNGWKTGRVWAWVLAVWLGLLAGEALANRTITSVTVNGGATTTVAPGATITVVVNVTTNNTGSSRWRCTSYSNLSGAGDIDHANHDNSGSYTETFTLTAPATPGTYSPSFVAYSDSGCSNNASNTYTLTNGVVVLPPVPVVQSINRASFNPSAVGTTVAWTVVFNTSVTGVDASDFSLAQTGGATGASIQSVTGVGDTWTVQAMTGTEAGSLGLNLVDDDSIIGAAGALGGAGAGNGNFTGQSYALLATACPSTSDILFCDDFERSNSGSIGGGWTVTPTSATNCSGAAGNTGCGGIDSDIPPFNNYARPRPNPTRSMFTRWAPVTVQSPTVNLAGKSGAQLSFWMRRGDDSFSECPEAVGENYLVKYRASDNTWKILAQYPSAPSAGLCDGGPIYLPVIELPDDALHANFAMQFYQPSGSGKSGSGGATGVVGYDYWHMDNVIIRETPTSSYTGAFCDNFEGGLGRWSVTAEGAPGTAAIGDARIGTLTALSPTHSLNLRWGYVTASTFKTDLRGVSGDITYWVKSGTGTMDPISGENLVVEYLNSSKVWTPLATYLGTVAAGTVYNGSYPIPADAKHAGFRLRFRQLNGSGYDKSYWHVDDVCVGDLLPTADLAITKTRNGSLVPGTNATYTLSVVNNGPGTLSGSLEVVDTLPAGLSYVAHAGTGWSCAAPGQVVTCGWSGSLAANASAPPLTITVEVSSSATGTLVNTATVSGTVNDNVSGNNTASDSAVLYSPSYVFTDRACTTGVAIGSGANPCNLINWSPQVAGQNLGGVYITALNSSGVPTQLSSSTATTVGFQFALSCIDPTAHANPDALASFSATANAFELCAPSGSVPTNWTTSTNLSFAAASPSVGPYVFNYPDVGKVELYMRNSAATSQMGSSGPFVVKPYSLVLTDIKRTADASANPGAADAGGATFVRAGEAFSATVTAVNASCAANLATYLLRTEVPDACKTKNFGKEVAPEAVSLSATLAAGLGLTANPGVGNATAFGSFVGGSASGSTFYWDEVGIIQLAAVVDDLDYLGAGAVTGLTSGKVGRFFPDHFDVSVTPQCTGFTYGGRPETPLVPGQPFSVTATAMNGHAGVTSNYNTTSGFSKNVNLSDSTASTAGSLYVDSVAGGNGAIPAGKFVAGVGTVLHSAASGKISYVFSTFPTVTTAIAVHAADADSATGTAMIAGADASLSVRSGRLLLTNAYGSELLPLPVPVKAQYWTATGWVLNQADTCTVLTTPTNGSGLSNSLSGSTTASLTSPLATGDARFRLTAPGAAGVVDISGAVLRGGNSWLSLSAPTARACFGSCGPRSPVIYFRERF